MVSRSRRPSLFEVISKAPQVEYPAARRKWFGSRGPQTGSSMVPIVAEPLTEAEAEEELAAGRAAEDRNRHEKEAKRAEKLARREATAQAKKAARAAARAAMETSPVRPTGRRSLSVVNGRVVVSFNTVASLVSAALVCTLMITAYSLGRKSMKAEPGGSLTPAAAVTKSVDFSATPLLPSLSGRIDAKKARPESPRPNADLSHLLQKPPAKQEPGVVANSPPAPAAEEEASSDAAAEKLNYLQIESFLITRERSGDLVAKDLEDVRQFLAGRGVKTSARRHGNGFVLYSEQGFSLDRESTRQRDAFKKKIQALGQEYRRSGGAYEFKGCDFVSYAKTKAGRPL